MNKGPFDVIFEQGDEQRALECLRKWKEILRLDDWEICLCICDASDINEGAVGRIKITAETCKARIWLLRHDDWGQFEPFKHDMEQILVHELLHIWFAKANTRASEVMNGSSSEDADISDCEIMQWHTILDMFSKILTELDRKDLDPSKYFENAIGHLGDNSVDDKKPKAKKGGRKNGKGKSTRKTG